MPRRRAADVDRSLKDGVTVATHTQLKDAGIPLSTITFRIRSGAPWQRLLPGVVALHSGPPTHHERRRAAVLYGGAGTALTGVDALVEYRVSRAVALESDRVHVLVPHGVHRTSHGFAVVTRTRRMPSPVMVRGIPCAPVARALVDACRQLSDRDAVRGLVAEVIQSGRCSVDDLRDEVLAAARQRTALSRDVLAEISAGVRSVAEARVRKVFQAHGVPAPRWNVDVVGADGAWIARPDAWWEDVAAALEIDSMAWHLSPDAYRRTQERQRRMTVRGILVLAVAPAVAVERPQALVSDVLALRRAAAARPRPPVRSVGAGAR